MLGEQLLAHLEHGLGRREGKTRCHGIQQTSAFVVSLDQLLAFAVCLPWAVVQFWPKPPIGEDQARDDAQAGRRRCLEQLGGCCREVRAKYERGRRPVRSQRAKKLASRVGGVRDARHSNFLGKRHMLQPVQQRAAERPDDSKLRKVNVRVDEAREQESPAPVGGCRTGMRGSHNVVVAGRENAALVDEQPAVFVTYERSGIADVEIEGISGRVENCRPKQLWTGGSHFSAGRSVRTRRSAKKMRSGVAGLSKVTRSP